MAYDDYLGDGVYASFDGFHIVLDLRAQDDCTSIALEPPVMAALKRYETRLHEILEAEEKKRKDDERRDQEMEKQYPFDEPGRNGQAD